MALDPNRYAYIIPWQTQFLNKDGHPLSAGFVEIFVNNTTGTQYISYQNWLGDQNPFRIPLDSLGKCTAIGDKELHYDIYVYNYLGNLEFSRINIVTTNQYGGEVLHDNTLTGDGTNESPLSATPVINGLIRVIEPGDNKVHATVVATDPNDGTKTYAISVDDPDLSDYVKFTDLATVATSGSYTDLSNKPNLATVAITGSYNDLYDKPTLPGQVQANWTENDIAASSYIQNKPNLATVATSGSYNDLSDKPTIPAAQVQSDWSETDTSSPAFIANKPRVPWIREMEYGAQSAVTIRTLLFNEDDPDGYSEIAQTDVDGRTYHPGYLVKGPYKKLLDSGINNGSGKGNSYTPVYVDTDGKFKTCSIFAVNSSINRSYTITSTDISNGYCWVDMATFPRPNEQSDTTFMLTISGLNWGPSGSANRLTDTDVSSIEVWGTREDHSKIGYKYRTIGSSEINNSDSHSAPTHPMDNFWKIWACGSTNAGVMKYISFKFNFASGTRFQAGNNIVWNYRLVQFT